MRRLVPAIAALALFGCQSVNNLYRPSNPYTKPLFVEKYLNPANARDQRIRQTIDALRGNPNSATLHNDLGQLLRAKGFPKDAEREFERAVDSDAHFYPAWYNLALLRQARGNYTGARHAFRKTLQYKPGFAEALFQMGLMEEQRHNTEAAVEYYAKAFSINRSLLDVHVNPRIIDSELVELALLKLYPMEHARDSIRFEGAPSGYTSAPPAVRAASPQPAAADIVTPSPPTTDPAAQTTPPKPPL